MKLLSFDDFRPGVVHEGRAVDTSSLVAELGPQAPDEWMPAIIGNYHRVQRRIKELATSGQGPPLSTVRLRAPIPRPGKIVCVASNYRETQQQEAPVLDCFFKSPEAVVGPGGTVVLPNAPASIFHHEAELAVVIGRQARNVPAARAMECVFGYAAMVDVAARDLGRVQASTFFGSSFDTFAPMGPWLVTADEVPDPHNLRVKLWVNGDLRQDYSTGDMVHRVPQLIEYASSIFTLHPGDVIACGSHPLGLGPLQDGDQVEVEIEQIGRFGFGVRDRLHRSWPGRGQAPGAREEGGRP